MNAAIFGRYFLDYALLYPSGFLCLACLWEKVRSPRRTACIAAVGITAVCLVCAALCTIFELDSNFLLLPIVLCTFWLLRWRMNAEVTVSQTAFLFSISAVMMAVCSLLSSILNARAEADNPGTVCLLSTSLLRMVLAAVLCTLFWFTVVKWSRWLLREYRGEAFWQSAWPLPAIYAVYLMYCMPKDSAIVLMNRVMIIAVLAVSISLFGIFLLLYEMYSLAKEFTRSSQLDRENQLLGMEARRYTELRTYMENTRRLRHDFRYHLHVIAGLAGHYDNEAKQQATPIEWKLELPRQLPLPEADLCTVLGNLLENALHASQRLPPEQRQVRVMARMLSPAMLGIVVENNYDGVLKKQSGILHSTKHEGVGVGLVSIETAVHKYSGSLNIETQNHVFRVNVLLNL